MNMTEFQLLAGESVIDSWTLNFKSPQGGKFNGKLSITNLRVIYEAKFDMDKLVSMALKGSGRPDTDFYIIDKKQIKSVQAVKSFFKKKVIIQTMDSLEYTFDRGMLGIDTIVQAIQSK